MRTELAKDYISYSSEPLRFVNIKIMLNDAEDTIFEADSIISLNITRALTDGAFGIGFTPSDRLSFTAVWPDVCPDIIAKNTRITVYVSFDRFVKSSKSWERLGRFYCEECRRDGSLMHVTAFDGMKFQKNKTVKFSGVSSLGLAALTFPCTMQQMLDYIVTYRGLTCEFQCQPFVVQTLPMKSETEYYTVRETLGLIASAHGKNARFNYEGKLEFKGFTKISDNDMSFSASDVLDQSLDGGEPFEVTGVLFNGVNPPIYIDDAEKEYDEDAAGVIKCTNPFASIEIAEYVWSQVGGLSYCGGSMELRGAGIIECGDVFSVLNYKYPFDVNLYDMCVTDISYSIDKNGFIEILSSNVTKPADSSLSDGSSGGSGSGVGVGIYVNDEKNAEAFNLHSIPVEYPDINGFLGEWGDVPYGDYSHTEGFLSHALGDFAHVEGKKSLAWGENSHAETGGETGVNYFAYPSDILETWDEPIDYTWEEAGECAHAESGGWALAPYSHAEAGSEARGLNSHAQCGGSTYSTRSFASGVGTSARGNSQTVVGRHNKRLGDDYLFIVGCGTASNARKNALEVDTSGNVHITGSLTVDGGTEGGSGGGSYTAGDGIKISTDNEISADIDGTTIVLDDSNRLKAVGVTIDNAVVIQEKEASYLLHEYSAVEYIAGNKVVYAGAGSPIIVQGYTVSHATNVSTAAAKPYIYTSAVLKSFSGTAETEHRIETVLDSMNDTTTKFKIMVNGTAAGTYTTYNPSVMGFAVTYQTIYGATSAAAPYGYVYLEIYAIVENSSGVKTAAFVSAPSRKNYAFATEAEYNAAVGLTYEPQTLTNIVDIAREV